MTSIKGDTSTNVGNCCQAPRKMVSRQGEPHSNSESDDGSAWVSPWLMTPSSSPRHGCHIVGGKHQGVRDKNGKKVPPDTDTLVHIGLATRVPVLVRAQPALDDLPLPCSRPSPYDCVLTPLSPRAVSIVAEKLEEFENLVTSILLRCSLRVPSLSMSWVGIFSLVQ